MLIRPTFVKQFCNLYSNNQFKLLCGHFSRQEHTFEINRLSGVNSNSTLTSNRKHLSLVDKIAQELSHLKDRRTSMTNLINTLKAFDFSESEIFHVVTTDPQLLDLSTSQVQLALIRWNQTELSSDAVKVLMLNNPSFLFVSLPNIEKRLPLLQGLTKNPKVLTELLLQCPNLMTEQWEQIQSKLDYLTAVMRIDKGEIVKCTALGKTLEHIRLRHRLVSLCGMYLEPSPYEHKRIKNEKAAFKNPPLKRIVDNEDISFARKICKISHEEYMAFADLFHEQLKLEEEDEMFSDSDSDNSDDEISNK